MKRLSVVLLVLFVSVFVFAQKGHAGYLPDDGTESFYPEDVVIGIELWDIGSNSTSLLTSTFGFYYTDDPGTLIPIFDPWDETSGGDVQSAAIYFNTGTALDGLVWDIDDGVWQASFTPSVGTGIGFYLSVLGSTLFTDAVLNTGGQDLVATYPNDSNASKYLIAFQHPDGFSMALEVVAGITPVPEPSTMLLLGSGLAAVAGYSYRRRRRRAA